MRRDAISEILKTSTVEAIKAATAGTCELIDPESSDNCPVAITNARELDAGTIAQFSNLLLDPRSWFFAVKRCLPRPTAVICLTGDQGKVRVTLGFSCDDWIITAPRERRGGFFDPVRRDVRNIVKSTFHEYASPRDASLWRRGAIDELRKRRTRSAKHA